MQDSFLSAFERLDRLSNPQAFQAWLSSIVVRTAGKRLRRRRLQVRLGLVRSEPIDVEQVVSQSAPPDVSAELRAVYGLLDKLSVEERIALVLRRVERLEIPGAEAGNANAIDIRWDGEMAADPGRGGQGGDRNRQNCDVRKASVRRA